jgi:hypothetical protein
MSRRPSFWLSPAGIVLGYLIALFAATAGVASFPFSIVSLGLLFVVVGAFFIVAIPVIVFAYLFMTIAVVRALMGLGRRLLTVSDQNAGWLGRIQLSSLKKDAVQTGMNGQLWDRWLDGSR